MIFGRPQTPETSKPHPQRGIVVESTMLFGFPRIRTGKRIMGSRLCFPSLVGGCFFHAVFGIAQLTHTVLLITPNNPQLIA